MGYCGADLKALCTEAALHSLHRHYPQIYSTTDKLVIDVSTINISASDFHASLQTIVPTTQRSHAPVSRSLPDSIFPLLGGQLELILDILVFIFPSCWKSVSRAMPELKRRCYNEEKRRQEMKTKISKLVASLGATTKLCDRSCDVSCDLHSNHDRVSNGLFNAQSLTACKRNMLIQQAMPTLSFQSRKPSNHLDDVFFDLSSILTPSDSSLQSVTQDDDANNSLVSTSHMTNHGFLSLSSHPHSLPSVHRPRLLLTGQAGMTNLLIIS